jgi:hypothetical protein
MYTLAMEVHFPIWLAPRKARLKSGCGYDAQTTNALSHDMRGQPNSGTDNMVLA